MKPEQRLCVSALLLLCAAWSAHGGNILVWYTEGSHWINLKPVLEELVNRGHKVTVLVPSSSLFMDVNEPSRFSYELFNVSFSKQEIKKHMDEFLQFMIYEFERMSYLQIYSKFTKLVALNGEYHLKFLDGVVKSDTVMKKLKEGKYNLLFSDPLYPGSELVAEILSVPLVLTLRLSLGSYSERHCGQIPAPPSFVPGVMTKLTDKMTFLERVWNFLLQAWQDAMLASQKKFDNYYTEYRGTPTSSCELLSKTAFWLMRTYWDHDFPRPFLPNFKYIGGVHCRPAKPLPKDMEEFVQTSGDAGIVVFSLGSMIKNMPMEKANMIASVLAEIPQKVLWRYSGQKPETLGANTRLYDWIPQNDLLGHPKTKAFITHGGSNGLYEATYHGIPMLGIPLFGDQAGNLVHMKAKGVALMVELNSLTPETFREALNAVINDKSYKESAMRLSSIHHDRPMKALDEAVFWIEYTMRNKGAKHLRVAAHELTWYQYHSLDVLLFLLSILLVLMFVFIKSCSFCFRRCCGRKTTKRKNE
ncbi:UDP-glucuronosyltransferase 2A1-like isoform X2 [Halichoeres trimaculatus]